MRQISTDRSVDAFVDHLVYLEATLSAVEQTQELVGPVTAQIGALGEVRVQDLETRRKLVTAQARCAVGDLIVDDAITELANEALFASGQDRKARPYVSIFTEAPHRLTRFSLRRQVTVIVDLEQRLQLSVVPEDLRARHAPALAAAREHAQALLEERRAAELQRTEARIRINDAKEDTNALRLQVYSQLLALAAQHRHTRSWADTFFRKSRRAAEPEDNEPEVEVQDAE